MEETKSTSKIVHRTKTKPIKSQLGDPVMIVASVGCFFSVYLRSQYLLFGFLLFLLSIFLTSKNGSFGLATLTPFYGMLPSLIKVTADVFRCIANGEPL